MPFCRTASRRARSSPARTTRRGCGSTPPPSPTIPSRAGSPWPTCATGWRRPGSTRRVSPRRRGRDRGGRRLPLDEGGRRDRRARARTTESATDRGGVRRRGGPGVQGPASVGAHQRSVSHTCARRPREVELYVDGDNTAARRTYEGSGSPTPRRRAVHPAPHLTGLAHDGRHGSRSRGPHVRERGRRRHRGGRQHRQRGVDRQRRDDGAAHAPAARLQRPVRRALGRHGGRRGGGAAGRPLPRPRDLLAAVQRARPRARGGREHPAARARPLPRHLRPQPRRVLHGAGGRPQAAHRDRPRRAVGQRPGAARGARAISLVAHELLCHAGPGVPRRRCVPALADEGITIVRWDELSDDERSGSAGCSPTGSSRC